MRGKLKTHAMEAGCDLPPAALYLHSAVQDEILDCARMLSYTTRLGITAAKHARQAEDACNGSLMRFAPVALYLHSAVQDEILDCARMPSYTNFSNMRGKLTTHAMGAGCDLPLVALYLHSAVQDEMLDCARMPSYTTRLGIIAA